MSIFSVDGEISLSTSNVVLNWHPDTPFHIETKTFDSEHDTFKTDYLSVSEVAEFLADVIKDMTEN